ncbi:hypothetical protein [Roseivirga pacifica]|uniref:hypothetical protein n=1 Tax=Roseivirga pacifica TaxID=1267423 RepID=UPI00209606D9|nr:hypothetical protein [Roseivirga pacifica]MCO6357823.1 hypothetical protein [Roseivirga pacifica]MCO6366075.1 hypothetical protein [Roseivirga pacifica]MCO6371403.1 hypothetical protein [Roseivirga pacifica]MCO6375425.1 hypothetical protein [Roseivirga pacifica]MCO6378781.1 hypothetical protein [Roseivirga pacifica]|tara:strand:+ start:92 stop:412 length:321 start_codon:yes stop_codon:yes gene_type:complete
MTYDNKDITSGLALFEKDFGLDVSYLDLANQPDFSYDQAYLKIMRVVEDLMERDFNALINVLYRIDVSEQKLKAALAITNDNPAAIITKMILERELQKVATRKKYS